MASTPTIHYQWQNPVLRKTIYPFREKKLRDFLLYYREVDVCRQMTASTVDPKLAAELLGEMRKLETELSLAKVKKGETDAALKSLQQKYRLTLNSPKARQLAQQKINLEMKLSGLGATKRRLEGQVNWYRQYAPEHPYYDKYTADLDGVNQQFSAAQAELASVLREYNQELAPFENEAKALQAAGEGLRTRIRTLTDELRRFPKLDASGAVNRAAALRWLGLKYERELDSKSHDDLLRLILERFDAEPQRFPKWLQYMVVHFSGMRYKSAHGSWADPRVLLESILLEETKASVEKASPADLERMCSQAMQELGGKKSLTAIPAEKTVLDAQISALSNPINRKTALLKHLSAQQVDKNQKRTDQEVLSELKARRGQMPEWAWKEIASRTDLRLETHDETWENLNPDQQQERWKVENERWRLMMDFWERRDITEWRKQHELTLSLVVTRAVCNEIAEHIQHLRGVKPAAGLTAKPTWYIRAQAKDPARAYFKRPTSAADFKTGASILWLGWVDRQPNPWQIAHPLDGYELVPSSAQPAKVNKRSAPQTAEPQWRYNASGNIFVRAAQIQVEQPRPAGGGKSKIVSQPVQQWLRWTHEATVVGVERMADGRDYVITFETGQIGAILRPLSSLVNTWDVFVGYVPPASFEPPGLNEMIDRASLLPPVPPSAEVEFGLPVEEEEVTEEQLAFIQAQRAATLAALEHWKALTPRQRQVVALLCQGMSTREIATRLDTSTGNIRKHLSRALRKFGLENREDLCRALSELDIRPWAENR